MLREIPTRQIPGEPPRRWFTSPDIDLFVWRYSHMAVDGGESRPGRYKGTPILVADGAIRFDDIIRQLREQGQALPVELLELVERKVGGMAALAAERSRAKGPIPPM